MLSILYYIVVLVVATVLFVLSFIALVLCYPFDKKRVVVHTLSKWITDVIFGLPPFMGRDVIGAEHIDPKQPYVITLNHNSMVDILCLYKIPLVFKWVSKREVYRIPIVGQLLFAHGDIVINRASSKEAMNKGVQIIYNDDGTISICLHIIVEHGINITTACRAIIGEVKYKVSKYTGVQVKNVDVCVDSVVL